MKKISIVIGVLFILIGCGWSGNRTILGDEQPQYILSNNSIDLAQFDAISNRKIAWGIGRTKSANGQPRDGVEANRTFGKYNAVFVGPASKTIYLTFDNGYENGNTSIILDTLKEKKVSAIFFLTGDYLKANKELVQRMIDEGHTVGNHGWHHKLFHAISPQNLVEEIMQFNDLMEQNHNYKVTLVRPPKGEFSERSLAITKELGYQTLFWSFAYLDFNVNNQPSKERSLQRSLTGVHPGAIYLLHSLSNTNVAILPDLIDQIRKMGYRFDRYEEIQITACQQQNRVTVQCQ